MRFSHIISTTMAAVRTKVTSLILWFSIVGSQQKKRNVQSTCCCRGLKVGNVADHPSVIKNDRSSLAVPTLTSQLRQHRMLLSSNGYLLILTDRCSHSPDISGQYFLVCNSQSEGRDSAVGTASRYGLDGLRIESRRG